MSSFEYAFDGEVVGASLEKEGENLRVKAGDKDFLLIPSGKNLYTAMIDGKKSSIAVAKGKDSYFVDIDSVLLEITDPSDASSFGAGGGAAGEKDKIYAPMPGKIVKIMVEVGDEVKEKQPMVIVEAMKMENQVNAKAVGKVKAVNFAAGDQVDTETPIIELELEEEQA